MHSSDFLLVQSSGSSLSGNVWRVNLESLTWPQFWSFFFLFLFSSFLLLLYNYSPELIIIILFTGCIEL